MGKNAQQWLENDYPREGVYQGGLTNHHNFGKRRNEVWRIDAWAWNGFEGSLKLERFDNLGEFICWGNNLTELDLTGAPNLRKVDCSNNKLRKLNIRNLTRLEELNCHNNQLTELDISGCPNLKNLNVAGNHFNINQVAGEGITIRATFIEQQFHRIVIINNPQQIAQIEEASPTYNQC